MSKIFVTGSAGFVGGHLLSLLKKDNEVVGYNLRNGQDLMDFERLRNTLDVFRPQYIYHLAAQAYVPESFDDPHRTFRVNTIGSLNILQAVKQLGLKTRILLAGTSEEYGDSQIGVGAVTEDTIPTPRSPYAISKLAMDNLGQMYAQSYGLSVVTTRAFNHTGPGRGEMYADSAWAKQIAEIELGKRKVLEHGNLETMRNYTDVRDIVKAYKLAIDLEPGVYNICSDQNVKMKEVLNALIKHATVEIKTEEVKALFRPGDFSFKTPSCEKFTKLTGWKPSITLDKTMLDILADWRRRMK